MTEQPDATLTAAEDDAARNLQPYICSCGTVLDSDDPDELAAAIGRHDCPDHEHGWTLREGLGYLPADEDCAGCREAAAAEYKAAYAKAGGS